MSLENERITRKFVLSKKISFPIICDPDDHISAKYHATFVPSMIVVNKDGKIGYYQDSEEKPDQAISNIITQFKG